MVERVEDALASMEPRSSERGNKIKNDCKNDPRVFASMEPRSSERGNNPTWLLIKSVLISLQWSHAHLSVETGKVMVGFEVYRGLQWSHAHLSVETRSRRLRSPRAPCFNGATLI